MAKRNKKILLLSDDIRMPSGVGTVSKFLAFGLRDLGYDVVQMAGALNHQEYKPVEWQNIKLYPVKGYGNQHILRNIITEEQPDALLIFTDPRFWVWLWEMEDEIRTMMPILYYHLWDDQPWPQYNRLYYQSTDWIGAISKLSEELVKNIIPEYENWQLDYIPHGIDSELYHPVNDDAPGYQEFLKNYFEGKRDNYEFVVLYNNRNIRRKMPGDVMLSFSHFVRNHVPKEKRDKCLLILHTQLVDSEGTDLPTIHKHLYSNINVKFSDQKVEHRLLNYIYNTADVTINLASNEGFGLATAESIMAGTPTVQNVTGGLQDQMGFKKILRSDYWIRKQDGEDVLDSEYNAGEWAYPLFPRTRSLVGSPPTPYIFDDRCSWVDAAKGLKFWFDKSKSERKALGQKGREYLIANGFTTKEMVYRVDKGIQNTFDHWKPRSRVFIETV